MGGYAVPYQISGGKDSNGTYLGKRLLGRTKLAFKNLTSQMQVEILAGDPDQPSWWRDVYNQRGFEIHHAGYMLAVPIWPVVECFEATGLGNAVQWGHWGIMDKPGSGCYVYMDSQKTLGATLEILAKESDCDSLPAAPDEDQALVATVQMQRTTVTTTPGLLAIDVTVAVGLFQDCLPPNTLTHFAIITGWDEYNSTLAKYDTLLGPGY